jgi:hypothetical protein
MFDRKRFRGKLSPSLTWWGIFNWKNLCCLCNFQDLSEQILCYSSWSIHWLVICYGSWNLQLYSCILPSLFFKVTSHDYVYSCHVAINSQLHYTVYHTWAFLKKNLSLIFFQWFSMHPWSVSDKFKISYSFISPLYMLNK